MLKSCLYVISTAKQQCQAISSREVKKKKNQCLCFDLTYFLSYILSYITHQYDGPTWVAEWGLDEEKKCVACKTTSLVWLLDSTYIVQ